MFGMEYKRLHGVDVKIARIFNTYGPDMDAQDSSELIWFLVNTLNDRPFYIYGDGTQTRSLCYVSDTAHGLIALMNSEESEPIDIGNPDEIKVIDLIKIIEKLTGEKNLAVLHELVQDDPLQFYPEISVAKETLNWQPEVSLEEGLVNTIEYLKRSL